jgi:hypothetical protein
MLTGLLHSEYCLLYHCCREAIKKLNFGESMHWSMHAAVSAAHLTAQSQQSSEENAMQHTQLQPSNRHNNK